MIFDTIEKRTLLVGVIVFGIRIYSSNYRVDFKNCCRPSAANQRDPAWPSLVAEQLSLIVLNSPRITDR